MIEEEMAVVGWGFSSMLVAGSLLAAAFLYWLHERDIHLSRPIVKLLHRPVGEVLIVLTCVGAFVHHGATKGFFGSPRMTAPREMQAELVSAPESGAAVVGMFSSYTNAVTNVCATGIMPAETSVFLRAHWPGDLCPAPTGIEVYAAPQLSTNAWVGVGTAPVIGRDNSTVIELPYSVLPEGWGSSVFFLFGLNVDTDQDGLSDVFERIVSRTDPGLLDSDGDGMSDGWEHEFEDRGFDPRKANADGTSARSGPNDDLDGDGLSNGEESSLGTDPGSRDSDGDGIPDGEEAVRGLNPLDVDSDGDGMPDGWEVGNGLDPCVDDALSDLDGDGLPNVWEYRNGTRANDPDTDGDGLSDGQEGAWFDEVVDLNWFSRESTTGQYLLNAQLDQGLFSAQLPFAGKLAGRDVSVAVADVNGVVYFGTPATTNGLASYDSSPVDLSTRPNGACSLVAGYWSDLVMRSRQEFPDWSWLIFGVSTDEGCNRYFTAEYRTFGTASGTDAGDLTFQVALPENNDENVVYVQYGRMEDTRENAWIAIGAQGPARANGIGSRLSYYCGGGTPSPIDLRHRPTLKFHLGCGTDPLQPDTDGDGMLDGWEVAHGFNPTTDNAEDDDPDNDRDGDPDEDGLTNGQETDFGTNPFVADSDGDGIGDGAEVAQASDPADASDDGVAGSRVPVMFTFGDQSGSHSEKYRLELTPVQTAGADGLPRSFTWTDAEYGECETKTALLMRGCSYELRMFHAGTRDGDESDYDYSLSVSHPQGAGVVVSDPAELIRADDQTSDYFSGEGKVVTIKVLDAGIYADYDKDGKIDEDDRAKLYAGRKLRHWVNDDDDEGDVAPNSESDIPGAQSGIGEIDGRDPDWGNGVVDGRCDLLDFAPVRLDIGGMLDQLEGALSDYEFRLSQADGAVKVVWTSLDADHANSFLTTDLSNCGVSLRQDSRSAMTLLVDSEGVTLPSDFLNLVRSGHDKGVILIEGCAETTSPLVFECRRASDDELVFKVEMPLSISGVEKMYRTCSLRGATDAPELSVSVPAAPENAAEGEKDLDVFFLHGFNVNATCARAWGAEVFKRLWQSGSNARFHILPWHGDYSWSPGDTFNGLHYQHNVWFAQRTAGALKRYIEAAQSDSSKRILMTHSLGNMVACEALREGLQVGKYFMFDAALPSEAIDETLRAESEADDAFPKYVRAEWCDYTNACWASNWYRLYEGSENDARCQMSWANRFSDALGNAGEVFNYYSSGDSVFTEQEGIPSLCSDVHVNWGLNWFLWIIPYPTVEATFENHCWQKQEVLKGMATLAGTLSGGWRFNVWQEYDTRLQEWKSVSYSPAGAAAAIADGSITNRPAFDVSDAPEMMHPNATEDDVFLALAKHVPALSHPAGGIHVERDVDENIDMNSPAPQGGVPRPNEWGRNHKQFGVSWLHSDMKDMAFFYVYKLYEQLVQKGILK